MISPNKKYAPIARARRDQNRAEIWRYDMIPTGFIDSVSYVCPRCKHPLRSTDNAFICGKCARTYLAVDDIPDFLSGDEDANLAPVFGGTSGITTVGRMAKKMDFFAPVYDSNLFGGALLMLSGIRGGFSRFIDRVTGYHLKAFGGVTGLVLDVACGPATYGRRIASPCRSIYGVDISMGMLWKGKLYIEQENVRGVHLARARVEALPFKNSIFDGGMCSGALHLFPNTILALREIARTMKPGAPLSVQTFAPGKTTVNRFVQEHSWVRTFKPAKLLDYLTEAGFAKFQYELDGIVLTFSARKVISGL
jgi:ubiquinone/menaquinone biosynthesis C-methylase UbiE